MIGMKLATTLLAGAAAGLLASAFLWSNHVEASKEKSTPLPAVEVSLSTAKVLQHCNMTLPTMQTSGMAIALNEWAPMWLASNGRMSVEAQNRLCTQLLNASLQGPTPEDDHTGPDFQVALDDTTYLMRSQIADEVLEHQELAENIAPLMGLPAIDVVHYFKSVKQGKPLETPGPTPEPGSHFSV